MGRSFDEDRFIEGHWFEIYRDNQVWFQSGQDCVSQTYEDGGIIMKESYNFQEETWTSEEIAIRFDINGHGYNTPWSWLPVETAFHVIDTDYVQYALVYGCDDWFWGFFHTQQSWLLSRTQEVSTMVLRRAEDTFAYEVPWYDKERRWMRIRQGEAEGCRYNAAEEDESHDSEAQFQRMLDETEEEEQKESQFTFDEEDFYDADMTAEEIQQQKQDEEAAIAAARPVVDRLEKDAFTFVQAMMEEVNFERFPESDKTNNIMIYYEDMTIGGGNIFEPSFYYGYTHEVENPAIHEWRGVLRQGVDAAESGKTAVGGYYHIKNIQKKNPNTAGEFVDV